MLIRQMLESSGSYNALAWLQGNLLLHMLVPSFAALWFKMDWFFFLYNLYWFFFCIIIKLLETDGLLTYKQLSVNITDAYAFLAGSGEDSYFSAWPLLSFLPSIPLPSMTILFPFLFEIKAFSLELPSWLASWSTYKWVYTIHDLWGLGRGKLLSISSQTKSFQCQLSASPSFRGETVLSHALHLNDFYRHCSLWSA